MKVFVILLLPIILGLALGSSVLSTNPVFGLSCAMPNMTGHFEETDTVFLGKALSKEYQPNPRHEDRFDAVTLFSIIESYKGIYQKEISVISSEWLWGVNFTENSDYVVFANNNDERFEHALCTLTQLASESNLPEIRKISQNYILTPLVQLEFGANPNEIQCKENLVLIQKYDGSPACVTGQTKKKLIERGWTMNLKIAVTRVGPSIYLGPTDIPSANNQFALNFYSHVTQDKESNVFFSPTSIFTAFAIAYEGAKDNTASEMKDVFGFESDESKRRMGFADMQKQLNMKQQNNTISLANALWIAENFKVLPEYVDTAKTYYNSEVESVNFASKEKGIDLINSWVDEKTHGKIKKIFEELDPATELVITNAIYFKGIWEEPFEKTKTTVGDFHVGIDNAVKVPMMQSKTTFPNVAVNDLVQIVELPYEGENFSMLILLPRNVDGMKSLEESLSADNLTKWKDELKKMKTKVYMPKFKLETKYDLKSILQEMGIHDAFHDADFTGIANSGLYIEKAVHKAFVEVNEEGTEAAAATGIAMLTSGPFEFTVDRPFIFIIQDNETGSILFIGKVVNPLQ
jgi:serpin B